MPNPAPGSLSLADLSARHGNEEAHGRHVADLALKLFDSTHVMFGAPRADRRLLEAACLLHDLGYGVDARRHAEWAANTVRRTRLTGFNPEARRWIAGLIQLHPAALGLPAARLRLRRAPHAQRMLYAAALLRIADALDYAHLQDAAIVSARATTRRVRVLVRCGLFPAGLDVARRQAALWGGTFPADIDLRAAAPGPPTPLLPATLTLHEGIRRAVFFHYRTMMLNVEGALRASNGDALHDLRIAVRRIRVMLRAFRRALGATSAARIDRELQQLNRTLGIARDLDVWIGFFSADSVSEEFTGHRLWPKFLAHQVELRRLQQTTVRRQLHGAHFNAIQQRLGRFLRVELPAAAAAAPPLLLPGPASRSLAKCLRRALRSGHFRHGDSAEKLHRLRIALRRLRYLGGFFETALGRSVRKVSRRAHAVERLLGEMRDADLALSRILLEGPPPPRMLVRRLERLRAANAAALDSAWSHFEDPRTLLELRRELRK